MTIMGEGEGGGKESKMLVKAKIYHEVKSNSCLAEKQFSFMSSCLTESGVPAIKIKQVDFNTP